MNDKQIELLEYRMAIMQTLLKRKFDEYLKENSMTEIQFSEKFNISRNDVANINHGNFSGSVEQLAYLSVILNYNPFTNIR